MSNKPIFVGAPQQVATHPRACSTAFERVFMTRQDTLTCVHEPFGDAFYFGPERLSERYENDPQAREASGFAESTFKTVFDRIEREGKEGKRLFIKDITHYLVPPKGKLATIAPSLEGKPLQNGHKTNGLASGPNRANGHSLLNGHSKTPPYPYHTAPEPGNPTVVPAAILSQFHFTFLIRHPRSSIPSYYRCTIPPLSNTTGFHSFMPSEAGYSELRAVFDFLRAEAQVGPSVAGHGEGKREGETRITVVDADDMLDDPEGVLGAYCREVGIEFKKEMLCWDTEADHTRAREAFEKWQGFHEDAINSSSLKPREHKKKVKSAEAENEEWREKFGQAGQKVIRECVDANVQDYEYLKTFALRV